MTPLFQDSEIGKAKLQPPVGNLVTMSRIVYYQSRITVML